MFNTIQNLIRKNLFLYYFFRRFINSKIFLKFYRPELLVLKKIQKKIIFLDVGSNDGIFVKYILSKNNKIIRKIYVIEPIRFLFQKLKKKYNKKKYIKIFNLLVSNHRDTQKVVIPYFKFLNNNLILSGYASNNLNAVKFDLKQYFNKSQINKKINYFTEKIETKKIDDLKINANFIKIIMAGCQYEILKGAEKTIKKNFPIIYLNQRSKKVENYLIKFNYNKYFYDFTYNKLIKLKKYSKEHHVVFFISKSKDYKLFI